jgi:penicillin amidase
MSRSIVKVAAGIVMLAAMTCAGLYLYLRQSLPQIDGQLKVDGLTAPIEIIRDRDAIPHVFAATRNDGLFGLGYVHAQDRLWQMELQRRIGHGRLSEVLGEAALPQDRFLRTVGFSRAAYSAWTAMPDWARDETNAYIAGINAFIATHHGSSLPPEFSLLRFEPEPWTGPDVVVWVKMMAWDLSGNYNFELLRHDLTLRVGSERMAQLMLPYPPGGLSMIKWPPGPAGADEPDRSDWPGKSRLPHVRTTNESGASFGSAGFLAAAFSEALNAGTPVVRDFLRDSISEGLGSNNWVVDGTMTASRLPLLANDPHLGARLPSTWYLAHVSAGGLDVVGATLPGTPAVALGRNRFIAWGATSVDADVQDLYREHLNPAGTTFEFRGAEEPITIVPETIAVKGGAPVTIDVRITRHGPLVSDAINYINATSKLSPRPPQVEPLALRWTALDSTDETLSSFLKLNEARDWAQFTDALRTFVTPSQNFVYADVNGHIGYYLPGRIPVRASGDGSIPTDGWRGETEWTGSVPFDDLPHVFDPPEHFIVTANNRPAPPPYPYLLGLEWTEPFRAQRIVSLLQGRSKLGSDDFARIQSDTRSMAAERLLPILLAHARPQSDPDKAAIALLRQWNLDARGDSAATAIFEAWYYHLGTKLVAPVLGSELAESYTTRSSPLVRFLTSTLAGNDSPWCDNPQTPARETCDQAVTAALREGMADLEQRMGSDMSSWRWDRVHSVEFPHQLAVVAPLRALLSRSVPNGSDWSTVNVGPSAAGHLYEQRALPGFREIVDLSPANDSRFIEDVGQSGHFLSPHYDDFLPDWRAVKLRTMRIERAAIENGALGHLRLTP